jgi:hypothetical protein
MANNKDFKVKNGIQPTVYHEGLGTVTSGTVSNLGNIEYSNKKSDYDNGTPSYADVTFKPDGTEMYVMEGSDEQILQFTLSTAWDVSTASYTAMKDVTGYGSNHRGVAIKSDGTQIFIRDATVVRSFPLSTAWDVSSLSFSNSKTKSFGGGQAWGLYFKPDGTKMFSADNTSDAIYQIPLSTAWDVSTASGATTFSVSSQDATPTGVAFSSDGLTMLVGGTTNRDMFKYTLSTAWDVTSATYDNYSFDWTNEVTSSGFARGLFIGDNDTKVYLAGKGTGTYGAANSIWQYTAETNTETLDLSTGSVFDLTPTSDVQVTLSNPADSGTVSQATLLLTGGATSSYDLSAASYDDVSFSVSSQENLPYDVDFKPDGTEMYVTGTAGVDLNQYTLSTAWDITTASFTQNFSYSSQDNSPYASSFKTDGTKLYMIGASNDTVFQYSLSTAWDISTASYDSVSFSVSSQTTVPVDIAFKSDGTKMYIVSTTGTEGIYQYSLSTAWDLSTASYDSVFFNTTSQSSNLFGIEFSSDGTKMFTAGITNDDIYQYSLSTAWDLSTASYDSVELNVTAQDGGMAGITFKSDGTKMFLSGSSNDKVYQYSVASSATITYPSTLEWPSGTAPTSPAIGETDVITFTTSDGGTTYQAIQAIDGAK